MSDNWEQVADLQSRTKNLLTRGFMVSNNREGMMPKSRIKTTNGTEYDNLDLISLPGMSYHSKEGQKNEVILISPNGDLSHAVALQIGDRANYFKLQKPGMAVSHPDNPKRYLHIKDDGDIEMANEAGKKVTMKADGSFVVEGDAVFKGNVVFEKNITVQGDTTLLNTTINGITQVGD
jgi:hypothetical protein